MARIRTTRPEFFTSGAVASVPISARLMYIAMKIHADDSGNGLADPNDIKIKAFPADVISIEDIDGWLDDLQRARLVTRYEVAGVVYYHIMEIFNGKWGGEQINKIQKAIFPQFNDHSGSDTGIVPLEGKGKEGIGLEGKPQPSGGSKDVCPEYLQESEEFHNAQRAKYPKESCWNDFEKTVADGADEIDKLIRLNNWTFEEVQEVLAGVLAHNTATFSWSEQLRSLRSMRKKMPNGRMKIENARDEVLRESGDDEKLIYKELPVPSLAQFILEVKNLAEVDDRGRRHVDEMCPFTRRAFEKVFGGVDAFMGTTPNYLNTALEKAYRMSVDLVRDQQKVS